MHSDPLAAFQFLLLLAMLAAWWLLPGLVASGRRHHQRCAIWVLTLLGGWTGAGWLIALVWACTQVKTETLA